ncbi:hypothetical protein ACIGBH_42015 [Streptomyces sp. NPDC085929]|uniref:hypothetical protein n=1 Tax=Streptomyces sp. NPDC085929 TaxID=3365739 RepID=UPI0037D39EEC
MDSRPPKFEMTDERGRSVDRLGLNLGKGDAADFKLEAYAEQTGGVYEWTADLDLLVGGQPKSLTLSDRGQAFRIAGPLPDSAPAVNLVERLQSGYPHCREHPGDPSC